MGMNMYAYKIGERKTSKTGYKSIETEEFLDFDNSRYTGDREFAVADFEWNSIEVDPDAFKSLSFTDVYSRPKNIDTAIEWIKDNIIEGNRPRLIKLMEDMRKDSSLHLYFSW